MSLQVQPVRRGILDHLQVGQVQNPHMKVPAPPMAGLSFDNPNAFAAWPAHNYTGINGVPMSMPAYSGRGPAPMPMARPLQMPLYTQFNKMQRL